MWLARSKQLHWAESQSHHPIKILDVRCIRIITTLVAAAGITVAVCGPGAVAAGVAGLATIANDALDGIQSPRTDDLKNPESKD